MDTLLPHGFDAQSRIESARLKHQYWSEAYISGKPGKGEICAYCCLPYSEKRLYGGFVAIADPLYQPGITTLYGCECCRVCYQMLANMNVTDRFQMLFTAQAYSSRPFYSYSILVAAREQGQYPPEMPCQPIQLKPVTDEARSLGPLECVHVSLIRWQESKGAPYYGADRFRKARYRW